jgi:hypothetical protein
MSTYPIGFPPTITHRLLVLAKRSMDYTTVEQDLGRVGNGVKLFQCIVKFVVVVGGQGCHPGLDFLFHTQPRSLDMVRFLREM